MNDLMQILRIGEFEPILKACVDQGEGLNDALDGGAGWGATATEMLPYISGSVYAFEPFPGNHRFFENLDPRINLHKQALAAQNGTSLFHVRQSVSNQDSWGQKGLSGYSSVGKIVKQKRSEDDFHVDSVRGDDVIPSSAKVDFIKLDLQKGEYAAMLGMERLFSTCKLAWIEFMGDENILKFLYNRNFVIFDTAYVFVGEVRTDLENDFDIVKKSSNSQDIPTNVAFRKAGWMNFHQKFLDERQSNTFVQTDLLAVHPDFFPRFNRMIAKQSANGF